MHASVKTKVTTKEIDKKGLKQKCHACTQTKVSIEMGKGFERFMNFTFKWNSCMFESR
jgi:hypothetical protein